MLTHILPPSPQNQSKIALITIRTRQYSSVVQVLNQNSPPGLYLTSVSIASYLIVTSTTSVLQHIICIVDLKHYLHSCNSVSIHTIAYVYNRARFTQTDVL